MNNATPIQFSIRLLLVATAAVAAALGAIVARPSLQSAWTLGILAVVFETLAVMAAVSTQGRARAFSLGVAIAALAAFFMNPDSFHLIYANRATSRTEEAAIHLVANMWRDNLRRIWGFAPVNGLICVLIHWIIWPRPPGNDR